MSAFLGAGIGYRHAHRAALLDEAAAVRPAVLEVMPDHFFAAPAEVEALAARYPVVLHDVGLSLGTLDGPRTSELQARRRERVAEVARRSGARLLTDHLALTHAPSGREVGHLLPLRYTRALLDHVAARVSRLQEELGLAVALENIAAPFVLPGDFDEPAFFHRLVERSGCGLLLDLSNLVVNAANLDFSAEARLADYPLGSVMQVHLAGARRDPRLPARLIDSHDCPVSEESFRLLHRLRGVPSLRAVIVERDDRLPPLAELCAEAARAAAILAAPATATGAIGSAS